MAAACNAAAERYRATLRSLQEGARDSTDTSSSFTAGGHAHSNPCPCWLQSSVCVLACTMSQHISSGLLSQIDCLHCCAVLFTISC